MSLGVVLLSLPHGQPAQKQEPRIRSWRTIQQPDTQLYVINAAIRTRRNGHSKRVHYQDAYEAKKPTLPESCRLEKRPASAREPNNSK